MIVYAECPVPCAYMAVTRVTRWVPLVGQELINSPVHPRFLVAFVFLSLVLCAVFLG